jgi:hypothetical protein
MERGSRSLARSSRMPKTKAGSDRLEVRITTQLKNKAVKTFGRGLAKFVRDSIEKAVEKDGKKCTTN